MNQVSRASQFRGGHIGHLWWWPYRYNVLCGRTLRAKSAGFQLGVRVRCSVKNAIHASAAARRGRQLGSSPDQDAGLAGVRHRGAPLSMISCGPMPSIT
jgi:hypothetical protein